MLRIIAAPTEREIDKLTLWADRGKFCENLCKSNGAQESGITKNDIRRVLRALLKLSGTDDLLDGEEGFQEVLLRIFEGFSQAQAGKAMSIPQQRFAELLNGKRRIRAIDALKLEKICPEIPAQYWLAVQAERDLSSARREHSEEIKKISYRFRL